MWIKITLTEQLHLVPDGTHIAFGESDKFRDRKLVKGPDDVFGYIIEADRGGEIAQEDMNDCGGLLVDIDPPREHEKTL